MLSNNLTSGHLLRASTSTHFTLVTSLQVLSRPSQVSCPLDGLSDKSNCNVFKASIIYVAQDSILNPGEQFRPQDFQRIPLDSAYHSQSIMSSADSSKSSYALAVSFIVSELIRAYESGSELNFTQLKGSASRKFRLKGIPKMADILQALPLEYRTKLWPFLKTKPVRTASGVAVVAVMCKPHQCPHIAYTGNVCVYCPGGIMSDFE